MSGGSSVKKFLLEETKRGLSSQETLFHALGPVVVLVSRAQALEACRRDGVSLRYFKIGRPMGFVPGSNTMMWQACSNQY